MIHISASSKVLIFQAILHGLDFLLLMEEILHQLRLVVYPIIYKGFSTIPGGWSPDKSFLPLTQLPPGLTHFGSLEVMPGTEPKMRGRKAAKTPVPAILLAWSLWRGFLHFFEVFNQKPPFGILGNYFNLIIIYNKFLQGDFPPQKVCSFQKTGLVFQPSFLRGYL